MPARMFARILGIFLALLAVVGFFIEDDHLLGLTNVDLPLDIIRLLLAVLLLWVGFGRTSRGALNGVLVLVGVSYLGLAVLGLFDREVFGLLPTELTVFDLIFHIVVGIIALVMTRVGGRTDTTDATRTT